MKFCSLGSFCYSAQLLRRNNLREESNPFDWLFSNIEMVKHCIEDDFKSFLDKSHYYLVEPYEGSTEMRCNHRLYSLNDDYNPVFNHHNPLENDDHYQHFVRSVDRFKNILKSDQKKVFVYINRPNDDRNFEDILVEALQFTEFLNKHVSNYTLVTICQSVGELQHSIIKGNNLVFIRLSCSFNTGTEYKDNSHDTYLDNVFKEVINDIR
jgi:hypothetical protein